MSYYWRRIGAYLIDITVIGMFGQIILVFMGNIFSLSGTNIVYDITISYLYLILLIAISVSYNVTFYHFFKFPFGKMMMGIKVYDQEGIRVSTKSYAKRELIKYGYMYATMGLYVPYQFIFYVLTKKRTYHERKSNTYTFIN